MKREQRQRLDAEFSAFVAGNSRQLIRLAELLTGDPHRARDIVQSALERAYLHWHRITADDPTAYVRRIVVNQHRDWWRRLRNRELPTEHTPSGPAARTSPNGRPSRPCCTRRWPPSPGGSGRSWCCASTGT